MMKKGYRFHQVTEQEFNQVKVLQEVKLKIVQVVKITGRSYGTIKAIYEAKSLADYKAKQKVAETKTIAKTPTADIQLVQLLTNINQYLGDIDERLKFIEENMPIESSKFKFHIGRR